MRGRAHGWNTGAPVIATVDIADLRARELVGAIRHRPPVHDVPGLRWSEVAIAVPLGSTRPPRLRRAVTFAIWDDEEAAARARHHQSLRRFDHGFGAVLHPIRAFGTWPGLPEDVPRSRATPHDGPVMVLTLGRLRLGQTIRFFRASRPAERAAIAADGFLWGTAAAGPPFVATVSIWRDGEAAAAYAYERGDAGHPRAIAAQRHKDFHHRSAFIRFAPTQIHGALEGPNALGPDTVARSRATG